jgi:rare lipoprotein A
VLAGRFEHRAAAKLTLAIALLGAMLIAGCSAPGRRDGSPPPTPVPPKASTPPVPKDIDSIPDAVPRLEPRSRRGNPAFYTVMGKRYYVLPSAENFVERGVASWYGPTFHGNSTANGEAYDMYAMTAAHKTLPLPAYARVTNLKNGRSVVVRINDRGPFVSNRIIDLSYSAAAKLDMIRDGTTIVEVRTLTANTPDVLTRSTESPPPELFVQAGAFADQNNAQRLLEKLRGAGLANAFIARPPDGSKLYRVRVGPVDSVPEFDRVARQLAGLGVPDAHLAID